MLRIAAFASSVVASIPIVAPLSTPDATRRCCTQVNTARCVSTSISRRVREIVEWSGTSSSTAMPKKRRIASESAARQAMPRSESMLQSTPPTTRESRCPA